MRHFLAVFEDARSEYTEPEELEAELEAVIRDYGLRIQLAAVRRGGLLALKVLEQLPPVRHHRQGRYVGDRAPGGGFPDPGQEREDRLGREL